MQGTLVIEGLAPLVRALDRCEAKVGPGVRDALHEAAEPVRRSAEGYARANIRNIGNVWSGMRSGVTPRVVYVAPAARRRGGTARPNLAGLLMREAMEPAADQNMGEVEARFGRLLDDIETTFGEGG